MHNDIYSTFGKTPRKSYTKINYTFICNGFARPKRRNALTRKVILLFHYEL